MRLKGLSRGVEMPDSVLLEMLTLSRRRPEPPVSYAEEALRYLVDEFVYLNSEERDVLFVSPSVESVLGYSESEFVRLLPPTLLHPDDLGSAVEHAKGLREKSGATYRGRFRVQHADGRYLWCEITGRNLLDTELACVVNTVRDIGEQVALEEQLILQARHDELTGLPNRRSFLEQAGDAIPEGENVGILSIDLDGFKAVNDSLGHVAGDELLQRFARSLRGVLRIQDLAARLGGDEFLVWCPAMKDARALRVLAERVRQAGSGEYALAMGKGTVTVSVGAVLGVPGDDVEEMLRSADNALYAAKRGGRNRVVLGN